MSGPVLDFWFDFASTYSYPSALRIRSLARQAGVSIRFRPFLLGPKFKAQGWQTSPFNLYEVKGRNMWRDLQRICADLSIPFQRPEPFPQNSLRSEEHTSELQSLRHLVCRLLRDVLCPATVTLSFPTRRSSDLGVSIRFRPFLLGPKFKAQGWQTSPFNLYEVKGRNMWRDLQRICADLSIPFQRPEPFPQNSL